VPERREVLGELSGYEERMRSLLLHRLAASGGEVEELAGRMPPRRLTRRIHERMQRLVEHEDLLRRAALARVQRDRFALAEVRAHIVGKNPLAILDRGYSIVESGGSVVRSAGELHPEDRVVLLMKDGRCSAVVEEITYDRDL
jgi:exodeoxyribonuclease VII large subunit